MINLDLSLSERASPLWGRILEQVEAQIELLRKKNDDPKLDATAGTTVQGFGNATASIDGGGGGAGNGPDLYPFQVKDGSGDPLYNCAVRVYVDSAMTTQVAATGTLFTDQSGTVGFYLTSGTTYFFYCEMSGVAFANPFEETVP